MKHRLPPPNTWTRSRIKTPHGPVLTDRYHRAGWRDASHTTPKRS